MKKIILVFILLFLCFGAFAKDFKFVNITSDWYFITDPENKGDSSKYYNNNIDKWINMPCNTNWETVIGPYDGCAWYKRFENFSDEDIKNFKYIYLSFGAVDEEATVYVNGKKIGEHTVKSTSLPPSTLWNMPFYIDIKSGIKKGQNNITVKVFDEGNAGGIYLPVKILFTNKDMVTNKSVVELNPDFEDNINQALKCINKGSFGYKKCPQPLSLLVFSDLHGDKFAFERLISFYNYYGEYFDDAIGTGDQVSASARDTMNYWFEAKDSENILFCIGNHDALRDHKKWDWSDMLSKKETYDIYYKNNIKNWNVKYKEGEPYFYKDYEDKKIRLIVIDPMLNETELKEEFIWFKDLLDNALKEDLSVVIANHFPSVSGEIEKIKSNWTFTDTNLCGDIKGYPNYKYFNIYQDEVDNFINNGGKFVCWFGGHTHRDGIFYDKKYPKQLNIVIDSANRNSAMEWDDLIRVNNLRSMDLANAMVIDTSADLIKIIRVGANRDRCLRSRSFLCINYKTLEIIYEE